MNTGDVVSVILMIAGVFGAGGGLMWILWNWIDAKFDSLATTLKAEVTSTLTAAIGGLKETITVGLGEAKADRQNIRDDLNEFRKNDREEHREMIGVITQLRIDAAEKKTSTTTKKRSGK